MERTKVIELIQLYVTGCLDQQELKLLSSLMEDEENFPWIELAEYQNLIVLIPSILPLKVPSPRGKQKMADKVNSLIYGQSKSAKKEAVIQEQILDQQNTKGKIDWSSFSLTDSNEADQKNAEHKKSEKVNYKLEEDSESNELEDELNEESVEFDDELIEELKSVRKKKRSRSWKYIAIPVVVVIAAVIFAVYNNVQKTESIPVSAEVLSLPIAEEIVDSSKFGNDSIIGLVLVDTVRKIDTLQIASNKETEKKILPTAPPKLPEPIEAPLVVEAINTEKVEENTEGNVIQEEEVIQPAREEIVKEEEEPSYFVAVEEMPEPLGGLKTIQDKIVYPEIAKRVGIEGKVYVRAFVDESGKVTKAELVKGIGAGCDEVAVDAVLDTQFKPGKQRGKPIKVQVTVPIVFKLR